MSRTFEVREVSAYQPEIAAMRFRWDVLLTNGQQLHVSLPRWEELILGEWEHRRDEAIAQMVKVLQELPDDVQSIHLNGIRGIKTRYFEVVV